MYVNQIYAKYYGRGGMAARKRIKKVDGEKGKGKLKKLYHLAYKLNKKRGKLPQPKKMDQKIEDTGLKFFSWFSSMQLKIGFVEMSVKTEFELYFVSLLFFFKYNRYGILTHMMTYDADLLIP